MKTKGIIIDEKEYNRLVELEKNFDAKVKEHEDVFKKGLEEAVKGNLVKILWVNDKSFADLMGCDLSDDGIKRFVSRENADSIDKNSLNKSYDRWKLLEKGALKDCNKERNPPKVIEEYEDAYQKYIVTNHKKTIHNLWWAFGITFVLWIITIVKMFLL